MKYKILSIIFFLASLLLVVFNTHLYITGNTIGSNSIFSYTSIIVIVLIIISLFFLFLSGRKN